MRWVSEYYSEGYSRRQLDLDEQYNTFDKIRDLWIEPESPTRILDLGCGAGSVSGELVRRGHQVVGLDIMEEAVARACSRGLDARVFDLNAGLPFDRGSFDQVLALDVVEHVFAPLSLLREAHRVLSDEGFLLLCIPLHFDIRQRLRILLGRGIVSYEHRLYDPNTTAWHYFHIRFFTLNEVFSLIRESGFVIDGGPLLRPIHLGGLPNSLQAALDILGWSGLARRWPTLFASGLAARLRKAIR